MHIAFICDELPPGPHGGVGSVTADLANGLAKAGHRVTIFVVETLSRRWSGDEFRLTTDNPKVIGIYLDSPGWLRWRGGEIWKRWKLLELLKAEHRRNPFDIIECMDNAGWLPFGGIVNVPTVVRLHGATFFIDSTLGLTTSDPLTHWFEKRTLRRASKIVGVSKYIGREETKAAGLSRGADTTIYNSVNLNLFSPGTPAEVEEGLILFANSIHPRKGVVELCKAMNLVCREFPQAKLVLLGKEITKGSNGRPFSEEAAAYVDETVRDRVIFAGGKSRAEVAAYMRRAQIVCVPSKVESFGLAAVEAMAMGKPVIFTRNGSGPEIVEDGITGLLCDPELPEDIAEKIKTLLRDRDLADGIGKAAREQVIARFDRESWVARNIDFYQHAAGVRSPAISQSLPQAAAQV